MSRARVLAVLSPAAPGLAALLLVGCGMYGDLYLEGEAPPPEDTRPEIPEVTEEPPIMLEEPADEDERGPDEGGSDEGGPDERGPDKGVPAGTP